MFLKVSSLDEQLHSWNLELDCQNKEVFISFLLLILFEESFMINGSIEDATGGGHIERGKIKTKLKKLLTTRKSFNDKRLRICS